VFFSGGSSYRSYYGDCEASSSSNPFALFIQTAQVSEVIAVRFFFDPNII
jgi:hypothetical protein